MPLNFIKRYNSLLELAHLNAHDRKQSLLPIFNRDIAHCNPPISLQDKLIRPSPKEDGIDAIETLYTHLTTTLDNGSRHRSFDIQRSERLHWLRHHIDNALKSNQLLKVFSCLDKQGVRTYVYNQEESYVVILEPKRNNSEYYLLTAYYLEGRNKFKLEKKYKRRLPSLY